MKELPASETVGMIEFDMPNNQNPKPRAPIYYGNQHVPHPTNSAAKKVDHAKVMRQTLEAK